MQGRRPEGTSLPATLARFDALLIDGLKVAETLRAVVDASKPQVARYALSVALLGAVVAALLIHARRCGRGQVALLLAVVAAVLVSDACWYLCVLVAWARCLAPSTDGAVENCRVALALHIIHDGIGDLGKLRALGREAVHAAAVDGSLPALLQAIREASALVTPRLVPKYRMASIVAVGGVALGVATLGVAGGGEASTDEGAAKDRRMRTRGGGPSWRCRQKKLRRPIPPPQEEENKEAADKTREAADKTRGQIRHLAVQIFQRLNWKT